MVSLSGGASIEWGISAEETMRGREESVECDAAVVQGKDEAQLDEEDEYMKSLSASLLIQTPLQVARPHTELAEFGFECRCRCPWR